MHIDIHTYKQFSMMSVGLGLGLVFVHLFAPCRFMAVIKWVSVKLSK